MAKTNATEWQKAHTERRVKILRDFLRSLIAQKLRFDNVTHLAKFCATHIASVEGRADGKGCNPATLLRNDNYKAMLLSFMAQRMQPSGVMLISRADVKDPIANALLSTKELKLSNLEQEARNLRNELSRLKEFISKNLSNVDTPEQLGNHVSFSQADMSEVSKYEISKEAEDLGQVCGLLLIVLRKFQGILKFDENSKKLIDLTQMPNAILANEDQTRPFIEWLARQRTTGSII